jgi:3-deoxy-D-manno-octulosonic acid kinase
MQRTKTRTSGGQVIWFDSQMIPDAAPRLFDVAWHRDQGHLQGTATGRGSAHFVQAHGLDLVLRPFRRGGLIGKFNADLYLRTGAERSRGFMEFDLLDWMHGKGLPVPKPAAARYVAWGPFYRADLITQRIAQAQTLADVLAQTALPHDLWGQIGRIIGQMHRLGVHHSDLNCRNILLDGERQVWLIDFDKCWRRAAGRWQQENLARLRRSLDKELAKHPALYWSDPDWAALIAGYQDPRG